MPSKFKRIPMVLTANVTNPKPDRRSKYDWRDFPVLKKGTKFTIVEEETEIEIPGLGTRPYTFKIIELTGRASYSVHQKHPLYDLLMAALEPVANKDFAAFEALVEDCDTERLLIVLFKAGKLTLDDVQEALDGMN